jgi:hypothetical protein
MGRPLKIQKYATMAGIMANGSQSASAVAIDQGYPPFAAPTALDLPTVVLPSPATSPLPFTGVVGGQRGGAVSATYPVVEVQVNITLASGSGAGVNNGIILRQKGARKFFVQDLTALQDEDIIAGNAYIITSLGTTNWQALGASSTAVVGTVFTATIDGTGLTTTGTVNLVGTCVLVNSATPTAGNMSITMAVAGDSTAVYISKLTNRFVQDFNGGETGGNANTGNVWDPTQVINDIEYAANFFTDESTFAKSGAESDTWGVNGSEQNTGGTLGLAQVEKYTS